MVLSLLPRCHGLCGALRVFRTLIKTSVSDACDRI